MILSTQLKICDFIVKLIKHKASFVKHNLYINIHSISETFKLNNFGLLYFRKDAVGKSRSFDFKILK